MNSNTKKGQSGVDLVMTYGWILVVGVGAVIILSQMGTFNPAPCEKNKFGFSQVMPTDWAVYIDSNRIVSKIENWAGGKVRVTGMNVTLGGVECISKDTINMAPGGSSIIILKCSDSPNLKDVYIKGSCYIAEASVDYVDSGNVSYASKGTVRGTIEEGSVTTTTVPALPDLTVTDIYVDVGGSKVHPTVAGQPNPSGEIKYTLSNPGDGAAGTTHSSIAVMGSGTVVIPTVVAAIGSGSSSDAGTGTNFSPCPNAGGWFTVTVCADAQGQITEDDETNNCKSVTWWCQGADNPPIVQLLSPADGSTI